MTAAAILSTPFVLVALLSIVAAVLLKKLTTRYGKLPLPPGPRPLPIIGNALNIPTTGMPRAFREMSRRYGDVVHLTAFGQQIVLLGTQEAAMDLLERRSAKYSDRVPSTMARLANWTWALPIMPYGPLWRQYRRTFHEFYHQAAIEKYRPLQIETAHRFLLRLLKDPQHFAHHIRYAFASVIIQVGYGVDIDRESTPYLDIAEETMATFAEAFVPGKYLVETFPILRFLTSWAPGAQFKRDGKRWTPIVQRLRDAPWEASMAAMKAGKAPPSIATTMMERAAGLGGRALEEEKTLAKDIAATGYAGGSDTIFTTMMTFFLAMAKYPEAQKKAQAELDAVVGRERLPTFGDRPSLPYIAAIIKECFRWRVALPLILIHRSTEDDEYRGYHIPKGTHVIPNAWAYTRDTRHYPDPEEFKPERYLKDGKLNPEILDPEDIIFGYGRRSCPGRNFSGPMLFAIAASALHVFTILPALDEQGKSIPLEGKMSEGVICVPEPFECTIKPRSVAAEALILAANS